MLRKPLLFLIGIGIVYGLSAQDLIYEALSGDIDIVVDIKGAGNYVKVQDAIDAVPNNSSNRTVIYIKNGTYFEKIYVPASKKNLVMIGQDADSTIISYDDYSGKVVGADTLNTFNSETFRVDADDFWAMNLTFRNSAYSDPTKPVTQALALYTAGDKQVFLHCNIWGCQDTYYSGGSKRAYFKDCLISGTVDFIFGETTVVFDSCQIHMMRNGGYYTAASTKQGSDFGYVFLNSRFTSSVGLTGAYLGRPWKNYSKTVLMDCYESQCISPVGWRAWNVAAENLIYAEYHCFGPGSDTSKRVSWSRQLTESEAAQYTLSNIYSAARSDFYPDNWLPQVDQDTLYQVVKAHVLKFLAPEMVNSKLQSLQYNNAPVKGFHPDSNIIVVDLPAGTTDIGGLQAEAQNGRTMIEVEYPEKLPDWATINVVTPYEASYTSYKVYLSVDGAYSSADLAEVYFNHVPVQGFSADQTEYHFNVPEGTSRYMPIDIVKQVEHAQVRIEWPDKIPGTYVFTVTALDGTTVKTYTFNIGYGTGITDQPDRDFIRFSNPFSSNLTIYINQPQKTPTTLHLYNALGEKVKSFPMPQQSGEFRFDTRSLASGTYFYSLQMNGKMVTGQLVKQ
jgi:pectinesterase